MSIIHDALKKAQQGLNKAHETPGGPPPKKAAEPLFATPAPPEPETRSKAAAPQAPAAGKIKSLLALICAVAITLTVVWFVFQQTQIYFPKARQWAMESYSKIRFKVYKALGRNMKAKKTAPLPMATITVRSVPLPPPAAVSAPQPTAPAAVASIPSPPPPAPKTFNIHGVMSNGSRNLVLIDDEVYQEGDEVDGVKIVKINLDSIVVDNNGKEEKIRVKD